MKRFEYLPLGKELKVQTVITKKQYQKLDDTYEFVKTISKKSTLKNYNKSDLIYNTNRIFYKYYLDSKKFDNLPFKSNHFFLYQFLNDIDKFSDLVPRNENTKKNKGV